MPRRSKVIRLDAYRAARLPPVEVSYVSASNLGEPTLFKGNIFVVVDSVRGVGIEFTQEDGQQFAKRLLRLCSKRKRSRTRPRGRGSRHPVAE